MHARSVDVTIGELREHEDVTLTATGCREVCRAVRPAGNRLAGRANRASGNAPRVRKLVSIQPVTGTSDQQPLTVVLGIVPLSETRWT